MDSLPKLFYIKYIHYVLHPSSKKFELFQAGWFNSDICIEELL